MKKIAICSLLVGIGLIGDAFAGGFYDIKFRQAGAFWICDHNDCLTWDGGKNYLQCDDDKGDVGDHVFAISQRGKYLKDFDAVECCIETSGDLWRNRNGRFLWCDSGTSCSGGAFKFDYGFEFCAKNRARDMGNKRPLLVDGGTKTENNQTTIKNKVGCLRCQSGYARPNKDYDFSSVKDCVGCKVTTNECVPAGMIDCFKAIDRGEPANWNGKTCNCGSVGGVFYTWNPTTKKCDKQGSPNPNPNPTDKFCRNFQNGKPAQVKVGDKRIGIDCPTNLWEIGARSCSCICAENASGTPDWRCDVISCDVNTKNLDETVTNITGGKNSCKDKSGPAKQTCKEKYKGYPERIKCCEAGNATVWQPKDDWVNGQCICVDARKEWKNGKCVDRNISCEQLYDFPEGVACCKIGKVYFSPGHTCLCGEGLKWVYDEKTKTGQCVADNGGGNDVEPVVTPDGEDCYYEFTGTVKCANGNSVTDTVRIPLGKTADCATARALFEQDSTRMQKIAAEMCKGNGGSGRIIIIDEAEVKAAESTLLAFFGNAKSGANVWKDAEGNFNTARLASDLTAGVVLGTVGGVVSGVVIKKKQVEKGFDALHCTVGGQTVADWGDLFNVGLRR